MVGAWLFFEAVVGVVLKQTGSSIAVVALVRWTLNRCAFWVFHFYPKCSNQSVRCCRALGVKMINLQDVKRTERYVTSLGELFAIGYLLLI